ncbi:hypothetical protein M9458_046087, partial [Cirrhinus mrigala]
YYSNECQRDLPLAKKHKPNPELVQAQLDKPISRHINCQPALRLFLPPLPARIRAGHPTSQDGILPKGSISSVGKEKLASRMLGMVEREMVDTEILSYKEDLENQDCLSHMEDLQ